jgi:ketosteroid isomerase-like protein
MPRTLPVVIALFSGLVCGCGSSSSPEKMVAAAAALDQQYVDALNKGDVAAVMALYPSNAEIVSYAPDGSRLQGWQAIRDYYAKSIESAPGAKYEFTSTHNKAVGNVVLGWGTFRGKIEGKGGPPVVIEGRYTDVKTARGGKWGYIMEHGSLLSPPTCTAPKS